MTPQEPQESISVQIANQIIDLANSRLENGDSDQDIASGLRHAAANFSAFAFFRSSQLPKDPNTMVEEFISLFEHYLGVHKPQEAADQGLKHLIQQAKNELDS